MRRVFCSGCFDAIHPGHIEFLEFARAQGDHLTVALADDEIIRLIKAREPIYPFEEREKMLYALRCVGLVCEQIFREPFDIVRATPRPDVWVFNRDDANYDAKVKLATELNIHVVLNNRPANYYSTSGLIERLSGAACR